MDPGIKTIAASRIKNFDRIEHLVSVDDGAGVANGQFLLSLDGDIARSKIVDWFQDESNSGKTREVFLVWGGRETPWQALS